MRLNNVKIDTVKIASFLFSYWRTTTATRELRKRLKRIDSLQDATTWERLYLNWISVNGLFNTVQQPIFNASGGAGSFADKVRDNYWTGQVAYNWLALGRQTNWYVTAGLSADHRRQLDPTSLKTYETVSWQHTGPDSVRQVSQKQLYPSDPGQQLALGGQVGVTYYHHGSVAWGVSANYIQKWLNSHQGVATLGVFAPVKAGDANVLLMPLVRWDSQGTPTRWVVGASLTTTLPSFVTPKK